MLKSVLLICFCMLLLNEASAQEVVQGFIGGSAVLPCHPGNKTLTVITAHWRYDDNKNVFDILNGQGTTKEQDPVYKGRTETFPAEYSNGNFTLKLGSLQKSDEGSYCCFIIEFNLNECVNLQVKEKPREIQTNPGSGGGKSTTEKPRGVQTKPGSGGDKTTAVMIASLLIPLFSVTLHL